MNAGGGRSGMIYRHIWQLTIVGCCPYRHRWQVLLRGTEPRLPDRGRQNVFSPLSIGHVQPQPPTTRHGEDVLDGVSIILLHAIVEGCKRDLRDVMLACRNTGFNEIVDPCSRSSRAPCASTRSCRNEVLRLWRG